MKNIIFLKLFYCFLILFMNSISNKLLADWPQFRGPTGDGRVNVISHPKKWSTKENLAWRQAIAGGGWTSFGISGSGVTGGSGGPVLQDNNRFNRGLLGCIE